VSNIPILAGELDIVDEVDQVQLFGIDS